VQWSFRTISNTVCTKSNSLGRKSVIHYTGPVCVRDFSLIDSTGVWTPDVMIYNCKLFKEHDIIPTEPPRHTNIRLHISYVYVHVIIVKFDEIWQTFGGIYEKNHSPNLRGQTFFKSPIHYLSESVVKFCPHNAGEG
jgi:hypothetical protein